MKKLNTNKVKIYKTKAEQAGELMKEDFNIINVAIVVFLTMLAIVSGSMYLFFTLWPGH